MRRGLKKLAAAFLMGAVMVSTAWAGASIVPLPTDEAPEVPEAPVAAPAPAPVPAQPAPEPAPGSSEPQTAADAPITIADHASLPAGQVLAGAAKTSIKPRPADYGGTWETRSSRCARLSAEG